MTTRHSMAGLLLACCGLAASAADIPADPNAEDTAFRNVLRSAATQVADGREAWAMLKLAEFRHGVLDRRSTAMLNDLVANARDDDPVLLRDAIRQDRARNANLEHAASLLARLQVIDPDNAYNALWDMNLASENADPALDDGRVQRMARSARYDDDFLPVLRATYQTLARGYGLGSDPGVAPDTAAADTAMVAAMGVAAAIAIPGFQSLANACDANRFPQRADDCRRIAQHLAGSERTLLDYSLASLLLRRAALNATERNEAAAQTRRSAWLLESGTTLLIDMDAAADPRAQRGRYLAALLESGEVAAVHALMQSHGIPLAPPAEWQDGLHD